MEIVRVHTVHMFKVLYHELAQSVLGSAANAMTRVSKAAAIVVLLPAFASEPATAVTMMHGVVPESRKALPP
jgi:hypothetical protein